MRNAPIKERIVAFRYNPISEDEHRKLCDALVEYLKTNLPDESFNEERINIPSANLPETTTGDVEPDWSKLVVSISRPSRFWNQNKNRCIQFLRDCFTINLITNDSDSLGSHEELFHFVGDLIPFLISQCDILNIKTCSVDYQNVLDNEMLQNFVEENGNRLALERILKEPLLGFQIKGGSLNIPFAQKHVLTFNDITIEGKKFNSHLNVDIIVSKNDGKEWIVQVCLSASAQFPGFRNDVLQAFLDKMHEHVSEGFHSVFNNYLTMPPKGNVICFR